MLTTALRFGQKHNPHKGKALGSHQAAIQRTPKTDPTRIIGEGMAERNSQISRGQPATCSATSKSVLHTRLNLTGAALVKPFRLKNLPAKAFLICSCVCDRGIVGIG